MATKPSRTTPKPSAFVAQKGGMKPIRRADGGDVKARHPLGDRVLGMFGNDAAEARNAKREAEAAAESARRRAAQKPDGPSQMEQARRNREEVRASVGYKSGGMVKKGKKC